MLCFTMPVLLNSIVTFLKLRPSITMGMPEYNSKVIIFDKIPLNSAYTVILLSVLYGGLSTLSSATNHSALFSLIGHITKLYVNVAGSESTFPPDRQCSCFTSIMRFRIWINWCLGWAAAIWHRYASVCDRTCIYIHVEFVFWSLCNYSWSSHRKLITVEKCKNVRAKWNKVGWKTIGNGDPLFPTSVSFTKSSSYTNPPPSLLFSHNSPFTPWSSPSSSSPTSSSVILEGKQRWRQAKQKPIFQFKCQVVM